VLDMRDPHERAGSRVRCDCGGLLEVHHDAPALRGADLRALFDERWNLRVDVNLSGVWRYRELVLPGGAPHAVTHPEGNTPLLRRAALTKWAGLDELLLKHEGHNPTGSFKDRGMTVGVTQARRIGASAVACASTGNTSASLAAYGAQAGIPALVFVPAGQVAMGKLAQSLAYGAKTLLVRGDFDACLRLAEETGARLGVYLLNSINPFRIEGQKTIVFELLHQLDWDPPDWIVLPAGNLGNTAAFGKALVEAKALGLIERMPRLAAVQAAGAAPFAQGICRGIHDSPAGQGGDRRHRDQDWRSSFMGPGRQIDSGDEWRSHRSRGWGDPRGESGDRRGRCRLRAGERREPGGNAATRRARDRSR
jgi:threonine synthase